ncbi:MAG: Membrane dipeptidase [Acidobacteriaceae bacterium]|nr:Membrane dipeptidase [Acidobacteriaceae bacterium]
MIDALDTSDPLAIHKAALFLDTHVDTPQRFADDAWEFTGPLDGGHLSLETARQGNLAGTFFALWVEPTQWKGRFAHRTLVLLDSVLEQVRKHPDQLQLCTTVAAIHAARAENKFAVLLGIEGGHSIENSLALLRLYHQLGVRYMTLTWANSNEWADSSGDIEDPEIPHHNGLSDFGRDVVREMNRLGMMVDVSHVSDKAFWNVLDTTRVPILASHSSARALTPAPRNLTDEQLRAVAANNGVVMVNFYPAFIDETWRAAWTAQRPERMMAHQALAAEHAGSNRPIPHSASDRIDKAFAAKLPRAPFQSLIDHIDHIARTAGIDHVGIGTDFDGIPSLPEEIDSAADLPKVTAALHARGYSADDLHKLLGGNLLRVFNAVQAAADSNR